MQFTKRERLKLLTGASALLLGACGGDSNSVGSPVRAVIPPPPPPPPPASGNTMQKGLLRESFTNNFLMGAAMTTDQIVEGNISGQLAIDQFNSVTAEFEMKPQQLAPVEGEFNFERADMLVNWAIENGMDIRGHALLWHEATPDYFFEGTRDEIRARLDNYISTVVNHFKGRVKVWDVVNEVVSDDVFSGTNGIGPDRRNSRWWQALGDAEYIEWAFLSARAADPNALLFINDYSTENPIKQAWLIEILQRLQNKNIPVDGVGHQFHILLQTQPDDVLAAIDAIDNQFMGLINHVTELDISFYNNPGECWERGENCEADLGPNPPADRLATQARLLRDIFTGFKLRSSVESVTTWGVQDGDSWLNRNPVERFNYPLLFDREGNAKPGSLAITDDNYVIEG